MNPSREVIRSNQWECHGFTIQIGVCDTPSISVFPKHLEYFANCSLPVAGIKLNHEPRSSRASAEEQLSLGCLVVAVRISNLVLNPCGCALRFLEHFDAVKIICCVNKII